MVEFLADFNPLPLVGLDPFVQHLECGWSSPCNRVAQAWGSVPFFPLRTKGDDNSRIG